MIGVKKGQALGYELNLGVTTSFLSANGTSLYHPASPLSDGIQ